MAQRMRRTQIYLEPQLSTALDELARRRGTTRADLIRQAARRLLREEQAEAQIMDDDPLLQMIGAFKSDGPGDTAVEHDRYLADAEVDRWKR